MDFDVLVVGDGSGSGWKGACGWCGVLVDKQTRGRKLLYGGMNVGSINLAELMPYLHALTWFDTQYGRERLKLKPKLITRIITDSRTIAEHINTAADMKKPLPKVQRGLLAALREFACSGYELKAQWAPRQTVELNALSDLIAGLARRNIMGIEVDEFGALQLKAANAIGTLEFMDPATGAAYSPYLFNREAGT